MLLRHNHKCHARLSSPSLPSALLAMPCYVYLGPGNKLCSGMYGRYAAPLRVLFAIYMCVYIALNLGTPIAKGMSLEAVLRHYAGDVKYDAEAAGRFTFISATRHQPRLPPSSPIQNHVLSQAKPRLFVDFLWVSLSWVLIQLGLRLPSSRSRQRLLHSNQWT